MVFSVEHECLAKDIDHRSECDFHFLPYKCRLETSLDYSNEVYIFFQAKGNGNFSRFLIRQHSVSIDKVAGATQVTMFFTSWLSGWDQVVVCVLLVNHDNNNICNFLLWKHSASIDQVTSATRFTLSLTLWLSDWDQCSHYL